MKKRMLSAFLALVTALCLLPMGTLAAESSPTVTLSVETKILDGGYLVAPTQVELYPDDTVYSVLSRFAEENGLTLEGADTGYVTRIGDLAAFDRGQQSGWMVALNDDHTTWPLPDLKDGDSIRFCYTYITYGYDLDLMDLVDKLAETCDRAEVYQEDGPAVADALAPAREKLDVVAAFGSNQAYLDDLTADGLADEIAAVEALLNDLEAALAGPLPFADIEGHWALDAVRQVWLLGLMTGTREDAFSPNTTLSRAMLATILYRMEGSPATSAEASFPDVTAGNWYTDAVLWAAESGIVTGYGDGRFGPSDSITREQLAAMLLRYAAYKEYAADARGDLSPYTDAASVSTWALDA
ncbi:MAG: S-layer homology domain-containing protein, partial [Ruminiclostridium sp.]|nr:S-layer homology domain-containing protein [Ruminiclostridium sp.]